MKKILYLVFTLILISCSSVPTGTSIESPVRKSDDVKFYYDLTYKKDDEIVYESNIWPRVYEILDESEDFFILDVFLFNDWVQKKESSDKLYSLAEKLRDKIVEKKQKNPDLDVYIILDPNNNFYGSFDNELYKPLTDLGVKIIYIDLDHLNDPVWIYSPIWRTFIRPFGNKKNGGKIKNVIDPESAPKVTMRSLLKALNLKANHRKVIMNEKTVFLPSANPHKEGSRHSNIAFETSGEIMEDIFKGEQDIAKFSKETIPDHKLEIVPAENGIYSVQYLTEGKIGKGVTDEIKNAVFGDKILIAQFYLADRIVVREILNATKRGVNFDIILNNSITSNQSGGIPNKTAADEIMKKSSKNPGIITLRWYNNGEEQFHTKLMLVKKADYLVAFGGSGNFTRRNLRDFNLESELKVIAPYDSEFSNEVLTYFDRLWTNKDGDFTLDYDMAKKESGLNNFLYKIIEKTGFSAF